jgi:hypothetical protein
VSIQTLIVRLRKLEEEATPGPWRWNNADQMVDTLEAELLAARTRVAELEDTIDWNNAWENWASYPQGSMERERRDAIIAAIEVRRGTDWRGV